MVAEKNKGTLDHDKEMLPKFSSNLSGKNYEPSKEKKNLSVEKLICK